MASGSRRGDGSDRRDGRRQRTYDATTRAESKTAGSSQAPRGRSATPDARSASAGRDRNESARRVGPKDADLPLPPDDTDIALLDRGVRAELRSLSKANADAVGKHLVAAGQLVDADAPRALAHARAARARASRVAAVREAVGIAAYHAGEWSEALTELRTARRISGDPRNLPLLADCERALGRPANAVRMLTDPGVSKLDSQTRIELLIVVAGARRDTGQLDAALSILARGGLDRERPRPGSARLWYAYGDALEAAHRPEDAATWFAASAALDADGELDAAERAAALL